ncbi:hypothetical protein [Paraburkholderia ribeironis]|uniref:hypothetical protein n=1 Tax=Paraburkholderia ribeironis TaxID=1247936 RepID=UPI002691A80A
MRIGASLLDALGGHVPGDRLQPRQLAAGFVGQRAVLDQLLVERGPLRATALRGEPRGVQLRAQVGLALKVLRIARTNLFVAIMFVESLALQAVAREREIALEAK